MLFRKPIKYYTSIKDMPVQNWFNVIETGQLKWLLKEEKGKLSVKDLIQLQNAYEKIYEEYMKDFGVNEYLIKVMELKRDIEVLKLDMIINDDKSRETFIDIKEAELKKLIEDNSKSTSINMKAYIEKYMGFYIDTEKVSIKDFYSYMGLIAEENKQIEKANNVRPN